MCQSRSRRLNRKQKYEKDGKRSPCMSGAFEADGGVRSPGELAVAEAKEFEERNRK